jgi:hypothetical protein
VAGPWLSLSVAGCHKKRHGVRIGGRMFTANYRCRKNTTLYNVGTLVTLVDLKSRYY